MSRKVKKESTAPATAPTIIGKPSMRYTIEDGVKLVSTLFLAVAAKSTS
jgi:hypothetical protein